MLTLEQVLRRSAVVTLGLLAAAGTATAQVTPGEPNPMPPDPNQPAAPMAPQPAEPMAPQPAEPMAPQSTPPDTTDLDTSQPVDVDVNVDTTAPPPAPTYTAPTYTSDYDYEQSQSGSSLERYGVAVAIGGGVEGFTNDTLRSTTDDGGGWNVRVALGTRSPIGFEAAYIGSAQSIDALGLDSSAILVGNGVEGKLRVNLLDANIQPFLVAGLGWRHYNVTNADFNTSDVADSDDVLEVPMGAGIAWKYQGFLIDARGEYRYATEENLVPSLSGIDASDSGKMHRWGVNANIGYAF